jgi:hypothetical protein
MKHLFCIILSTFLFVSTQASSLDFKLDFKMVTDTATQDTTITLAYRHSTERFWLRKGGELLILRNSNWVKIAVPGRVLDVKKAKDIHFVWIIFINNKNGLVQFVRYNRIDDILEPVKPKSQVRYRAWDVFMELFK